MQHKKSQSMTINTVIVAVLALVVLVVSLVIFTRTSATTTKNLGGCNNKGGVCAGKNGCDKPDYPIQLFVTGDCPNSEPKSLCCLKAGLDNNQIQKSQQQNIPSEKPPQKDIFSDKKTA